MQQYHEIAIRIPLTGDAMQDARLVAGLYDPVATFTAAVNAVGSTVESRNVRAKAAKNTAVLSALQVVA